jgi:hypothetical protein
MAYDINDTSNLDNNSDKEEPVKIKQKKEPSKHSEQSEEQDYEDEEEETPVRINQNIYSTQGIETKQSQTKELLQFDFSQFYNLNVDGETKELFAIMNRYSYNNLDIKLTISTLIQK